jgi:hypothetical protein
MALSSTGVTPAPPGLIDPVDEAHQVHGDRAGAQDHNNIAESRHSSYLLQNNCSICIVTRTNVFVKHKIEQNF